MECISFQIVNLMYTNKAPVWSKLPRNARARRKKRDKEHRKTKSNFPANITISQGKHLVIPVFTSFNIIYCIIKYCKSLCIRRTPIFGASHLENKVHLWEESFLLFLVLKAHCTTCSYLCPLYNKQCLIGDHWSPIILFFLC